MLSIIQLFKSKENIILKELSSSDINQFLIKYEDGNDSTPANLIKSHQLKPNQIKGYGIFHNKDIKGGIIYAENPKMYTRGLKVDCKILFFYIDPEFRGLGFGKKMISNIVKKYKTVFLTTDSQSSDTAKKIYTNMGFKMIDKSNDHEYYLKG